MKDLILPWVMILTYGGESRAIDHVEFETRQLCESAKALIERDYRDTLGWATSAPRMFCVQRANPNSTNIKPER